MTADGFTCGIAGYRGNEQLELLPKVTVAGALDRASQIAQAGDRVMRGIALTCDTARFRVIARMQQSCTFELAVLGNKRSILPAT
jgi:hypothetical protein